MKKRLFIQAAAMLAAGAGAALGLPVLAQVKPLVEVWKDPSCGCCGDWVSHLQASGFQVKVNDTGNAETRKRLGVPEKMGSCHTGLVAGYALEGHVPAREIHRLLKERPQAIGLAVPGMPVGSPGMDGAVYNGRKDPYDVVLLLSSDKSRVYQSYPAQISAKS